MQAISRDTSLIPAIKSEGKAPGMSLLPLFLLNGCGTKQKYHLLTSSPVTTDERSAQTTSEKFLDTVDSD